MSQAGVRNIGLIGFMGVGKSAVGRTLAKRLKRRFVDLDRVIEKSEGMKVREIFAQKGEDYFRRLEKLTLAQVLQEEGQIVATGGGVIMDPENLNLLREKTLLVCLTASTDVLLSRVGNGSKRPLLKGPNRKERIEALLKERQSYYAQAHVTIDTSKATMDQAVDQIVAVLESKT
ncbi:MAG: shikimate kinase [Candidatus Binatia bacterium]